MKKTDTGRRNFLKAAASATAVGAADLAMASAVAPNPMAVLSESGPMPHRELGNTGVEVPILQLGTAQDLNQTYDKVMHRCFAGGVTWFDTALAYGWGASHRAIANFIGQIGDRKKLWLTSKSGSRSVRGFMRDIDRALSQLGTGYLDLYLMHAVDDTRMLEPGFLEAGRRLRASGKTRFFGFSCHGGDVPGVMNKAARVGGIDAILFRYNFRKYGDRELNLAIDACHKAGIGLLAMKTMGAVPPNIEKVVEFRSQNFTLGQAKLKSVWADERIDSLVSEMDSVQVARENIAAAKTETSLTAEEVHQLNQLAALTADYACTGCSQFCESAVEGEVSIEASLRYLMYYESYGKKARARELYNGIPEQARQITEESLRAACAVCPQGIDIPARMRLARELLA